MLNKMYNTKKEVDAHVRSALSKMRSETERQLRGYTIAKLYYKINEYIIAEQYVNQYLIAKEDNYQPYKLLGQIYQRLNKFDKALQAYQRSLQLNPKQPEILVEVCQLLNNDKNLNLNTAKYWCDLADNEHVQHDAVLTLRLRLMQKDQVESSKVEDLLQREIRARPNDVSLRVRLLRNYIELQKLNEAFKYVYNVEMSFNEAFTGSSEWYNIVWLVLTKYEKMPNAKTDWDFWLLLITCLERQVYLSFSLSNGGIGMSGITETANLLFNLDQYLLKLTNSTDKFYPPKELVAIFLDHYRGQMLLHASALIIKREVLQNKNKWKETIKVVLPLLLLAYQIDAPDIKEVWMKHCDEHTKQLLQHWSREGAFRCAQAGRILLSCIFDDNKENDFVQGNTILDEQSILWISADDLLSQIRLICSDKQWRRNVFAYLFCNSDQKIKEQTSLLIKSPKLFEPIYELPRYADVERYEENAQFFDPKSLHHMVYICLSNENLAYVRARFFSGLNFSTQNLAFCGVESLNQLDVDTFLYASTIQAKRVLDLNRNLFNAFNANTLNSVGKPRILPYVILKDQLCTEEQASWWLAAYQYYKNLANENLSEMRSNLQYGIEAVRGVNGPKVDMFIVFKLGEIFVKRALEAVKHVEKGYLEERAENLYKYGLNMLKMHYKGFLEPFRKYFKYAKSNSSAVERAISAAAEDAVSYLAERYFKKSDYEELIEELSGIQLPQAAYIQAEAYRKLDEASKAPRQAKRMYLDRAVDCLHQTLVLLKSTQVDPNHPLNAVIHSDLKRLQHVTNKMTNKDKFLSPYGHNNSSTYEDAESELFVESLNQSLNRSRRETAAASLLMSTHNTEMESLVKQMANTLTFVKEELVENIKPEVLSMRKEITSLKDKIAQMEESMKKRKNSISNTPSRDEASNVLDDFYLIEDALQNQMYNQTPQQTAQNMASSNNMFPGVAAGQPGSLHIPFPPHQHQQPQPRIPTPNALQMQHNAAAVAAAAAYNSPMFNAMNYYTQSQYMGAGAAGPMMLGQRNPLSLSYMDPASLNFNMPPNTASLLPPPTQDNRSGNLYGLLSQQQQQQQQQQQNMTPQYPQLSVSLASLTSSAGSLPSSTGLLTNPSITSLPTPTVAQFNKALNNQPVEKGPPANVVITSSDPLPNPNTMALKSQQPTLSVTIPSHHIKPSIVQTPDAIAPSAVVSQSIAFNGFSTSSPFMGFGSQTPSSSSIFSGQSSYNNITAPKPTISSTTFSFKQQVQDAAKFNNSLDSLSASSELNISNDQEIEYDPRPDFQPIIPLPEEIVVKTGEEDEEVIFSHRAKLFRYAEKEWKERGIGDIKILKGKDGQSRILMRRDQIHKICANHKITKDITINFAKKETKGLIWAANDYADEELKLEKFFVRFKQEETAQRFLKAFQNAQKESKNLEKPEAIKTMLPPTTVSGAKTEDKNRNANAFGLAKSSIANFATSTPATKSESDSTLTKPHASVTSLASTNLLSSTPSSSSTSVTTTAAASKSLFPGFNLPAVAAVSTSDSSTKTATSKPLTTSPFANFTFGAASGSTAASTSSAVSTTTTTNTGPSPFTNIFSNIGKSTPSPFTLPAFQNIATTTTITQPTTTTMQKPAPAASSTVNKSIGSDNEEEYIPTATFKPVIPLPDLIEVSTGEENEKVLFEHRAKLLRFDKETSEWKERGIGNIKILQTNNDVNKVRLVMRREQIHKLCCNQRLYKDTVFKYAKNSHTAITWAGQDYSENEMVTEMLTVRFKTAETCKEFYDTILKAQAKMTADGHERKDSDNKITEVKASADEKPKGFGDAFKPKAGAWTCDVCYIPNLPTDLYCIACETPKDDTVPKKTDNLLSNIGTNKSTFNFGFAAAGVSNNVTTTTGAKPTFTFGGDGNDGDGATSVTSSIGKPTATASFGATADNKVTTTGFSDKFKPKAGSWTCNACYLSNSADVVHCKACNEPKDATIPKKEESAGVLDLKMPTTQKFNFGFAAATATTSAAAATPLPFGATPSSTQSLPKLGSDVGAIKDVAKSFSFSIGTADSTTTTTTSTTTSTETVPVTIPPMGKPTFTFTMQTANTGSATGAGGENSSPSFSLDKKEFNFTMKPKSPGKSGKSPLKFGGGGDNDAGGDDAEDGEYQEEENNTYFTPVIPLPDKIDVKTGEEDEELLYVHRAKLYRFSEGEWKERGLGDVKILRHKETKKLRVVMRREQILKICLNHTLNDEVSYKQKDDKSWLFVVNDFSEGTVELSQFSLRFKSKEIAQGFMDAVNAALKGTAEAIEMANATDVVNANANMQAPESTYNISEADRQTADEMKLPYEFFSPKMNCTGCRGCDPETFEFDPKHENEVFVSTEEMKEPLLPMEMPELEVPKHKVPLFKQSILTSVTPTITTSPKKNEKNIFSGFGSMKVGDDNEAKSLNVNMPSTVQFSFGSAIKALDNKSQNAPTSGVAGAATGGFVFGSSTFGLSSGNGTDNKETSKFGGFTTATNGIPSIFGGNQLALGVDGDNKSIFGNKPFGSSSFGGFGFNKSGTQGPIIFGSGVSPFGAPITKDVAATADKAAVAGDKNDDNVSKEITLPNFADLAEKSGTLDFSTLAAKADTNKTQQNFTFGSGAHFSNTSDKKEDTTTPATFADLSNKAGIVDFASLAKANANTTINSSKGNTSGDFSSPSQFIGLTNQKDAFTNFSKLKNNDAAKNANESFKSVQSFGDDDNDNYDPHYEPIIPLPKEVAHSTGEEDEIKLFGERAKLYRYDVTTKEWKERGVGEIKILQHKTMNNYRLVLRREQVHKLVLNLGIHGNFSYDHKINDPKSFVWAALNYAESPTTGVLEQLAVRFKKQELAQQFSQKLDECIAAMRKHEAEQQ